MTLSHRRVREREDVVCPRQQSETGFSKQSKKSCDVVELLVYISPHMWTYGAYKSDLTRCNFSTFAITEKLAGLSQTLSEAED